MLIKPQTEEWHHVYAHIDADAFFVSCEQVRHPELKGKPVCVASSLNAFVVAKSYEAKKFGIKTGTSVGEAKKLCPKVIIICGDFDIYGKISNSMFSILRKYTPDIEIFSIDECFLDLKGTLPLHNCNNYKELGDKIRNDVKQSLGITVSIGISVTRLLAKLASKTNKPDGTTIIPQSGIKDFLKDKDVDTICGIGRRRKEELSILGIYEIPQFMSLSYERIQKLFGKNGLEIWFELQGYSVMGLQTNSSYPKSIMKTSSFDKITTNKYEVLSSLETHIERAYKKLKKEKMLTNLVALYFRFKDMETVLYPQKLSDHTDNFGTIRETAIILFNLFYKENKLYRSCGIYLGDLLPSSQKQYSIESLPSDMEIKRGKIMEAKRFLERKYGKNILFSAISMKYLREDKNRLLKIALPVLN